jgi:hypothetical protein
MTAGALIQTGGRDSVRSRVADAAAVGTIVTMITAAAAA